MCFVDSIHVRLQGNDQHSRLRCRTPAYRWASGDCHRLLRRFVYALCFICTPLNRHLGQPADNAAHFVDWLSSLKSNDLSKVSYAIFGCGNHDWASTYQRIPTLCDDLIAKRGGERIIPRGLGDAGSGDFFETFEKWETSLWDALHKVCMFACADSKRCSIVSACSYTERRRQTEQSLAFRSRYWKRGRVVRASSASRMLL